MAALIHGASAERAPGEVKPVRLSVRTGVLLLALFVLLAFALRVLRLDFQPLWWDEGYSVWFATHPLGQMASLTAQDIHPPLYYALLHGWIGLLGAGPVSLRLLSVLFGVLAIPAIYLAGRRMLSRRAALLAAFLLAINPLHVYYSQEVRMYGLVALLSIGVLAAAWERISESTNQRISASLRSRVSLSSVVYILLTTTALYTQYYAIFLPIGLTLYACWRWRRDGSALARWLAAQVVVAGLYLPWVIYAAPKLVPYVSQKVVQDADRPLDLVSYFARHLSAFLSGHLEGPLASWWPAALLLIVPLVVGRLLLNRRAGEQENRSAGEGERRRKGETLLPLSPAPVPMLATVTLTALALGWLISLRYPFFPDRGERLLLLALPPFTLLLAAALDALWARARWAAIATLGLVVAMCAASLAAFYLVPRYPGDDYRPLIARTVEQGLPEDTAFAVYPWQIGYWRSYGSANGPTALLTPDADWTPGVAAALDAALARGKVWFPAHLALGAILEKQVEAHLTSRAAPFINEWYGPGTRLSGWSVTPESQAVDAPAVRFPLRGADGVVELIGVDAARQPIPAANAVLPITLRWRVPETLPVLGVSVRLVDSIGRIWAQHDYETLGIANCELRIANHSLQGATSGQIRNTQHETRKPVEDCLGLLIPAGTPPGRYFVEVAVHPKGDGRPLDVLAPDGRSLGAAARLFELIVAPADRILDPERLPIGTRRAQDFADGLRLLGHTLDDRLVAPGEARPVNLFWQAAGQPQADTIAFVQLLDAAGQVAAGWEAPPGGAYATSAWQPGTLMRTQATFRPRADLPDGHYRLIAGLFRATDKARLRTTSGADHVILGDVTVRGRPHDRTPPKPQHPADIAFGQTGRLIGYDLAAPSGGFQPGAAIPLTLYWQAGAATDRPHTAFVHLVDEAGAIQGYGDGEPGGGNLPTTSWLAGEYLTDAHQINVNSAAPPGAYRLRIGLYDPTTGQRLLTPDGKDYVEIGPVTVQHTD